MNTKTKKANVKKALMVISYWIMVILVPAGLLAKICWATSVLVDNPVPDYKPVEQTIVPKASKEEVNVRDYVLEEVKKAGLNPKEADCIIKNESGWNTEAQIIEPNSTISSGLWQINSVHKGTILPSERLNYKTATKWAIEKRLRDGNFCAWTTAKVCGLCK
jgi:hypothetical protein